MTSIAEKKGGPQWVMRKQSPKSRRRERKRNGGAIQGNNNRNEGDWKRALTRTTISGGFTSVYSSARAQPDVMIVKMRYETSSAFTSTAGAASYVQVKGNSIYRPYVGNTDSCGGYARMYADYEYAAVIDAKLSVRLWGGVSGQDEPFRLIGIPCTAAQYSTYSAFSNVCQLYDVPHSVQKTFSPGGPLPSLAVTGTNAAVLLGTSKESGLEFSTSSLTSFAATTGADPNNLWYFLIGYQNFAGTTTTNQQAQVSVEYTVKFFRPIATPVQVSVNRFGMEEIPPAKDGAELKLSRYSTHPLSAAGVPSDELAARVVDERKLVSAAAGSGLGDGVQTATKPKTRALSGLKKIGGEWIWVGDDPSPDLQLI